jgi:sensor histidine kinase YesM
MVDFAPAAPAPPAATGCPNPPGLHSSHPLELIPFFRRWPQSVVRDFVYTIIWNTLFAAFFTLLSIVIDPDASLLAAFRDTFVFAQCIGFVIFAGFFIGDRIFGRRIHQARLSVRALYYSVIPILSVFPGYLIAFWILRWRNGFEWLFAPRSVISIIALSLVLTGILLLIFIPRERAARAEATIAREQARVAAAEKETTTAQLKLLEAQVEPHFLYNTLANVVSLVDAEPALAKRMIERLIALLRATAAAATGSATLGGQVELLRAYLEILELRMGARLQWRIDVPAELERLKVPPMLLQPVVENAIKHGLEPNVDGGALTVTVRRDDRRLLLEVADTGRGIRVTTPLGAPGLGLANLRARLAAQYGAAAQVQVSDNVPHGTRVAISLPLEPSGDGAVAASALRAAA